MTDHLDPERVAFDANALARTAFAEAILRKLVRVPERGRPVLYLGGGRIRPDGTEVPYTLEDSEQYGIVDLTVGEAAYIDLLRGEHA